MSMYPLGPRYISTENSTGYLQRVQCRKFYLEEAFDPSDVSSSAINMDILTDIKQTCLGQGLGVTITARKSPFNVHHEGPRSYAALSSSCPSKLNICKQ